MRFITIFIFLISLQVNAQESLKLTEAINRSLERNFDIVIEHKRTEVSRNNNSWGQAGLYPSIELFIGQNNSRNNNIKVANPFQLQGVTTANGISPGVSMNWVLLNGFKVFIEKSRLEQLQAESLGNADIVISNTVEATIMAYYSVLLQSEILNELKKQLDLSRDKYEYVQLKSEMGSAVSSDLLLEETNYLNDSTNYLNQFVVYRNSLRNLNFLLAEPDIEKEYELSGKLEAVPEQYNIGDLVQKMESGNVDLQKQYITESIRLYETRLAERERLPQVTISAGYSRNYSRVDLSEAYRINNDGSTQPGPQDPLTAASASLFGNLRVSFTLFNGGRINRAIKNAEVQAEVASMTTQKMKYSLTKDISSALDQYNARLQLLAINQRKLEVAQQNLDIANEKFRNGTINSFDFRTVQNNQLSAAIQYLVSTYNVLDSQVTLLRLTGGIMSDE